MNQLDNHHIPSRRFEPKESITVEVTPNEHRWIHTLEQFAKTIDECLGTNIIARINKKYEC